MRILRVGGITKIAGILGVIALCGFSGVAGAQPGTTGAAGGAVTPATTATRRAPAPSASAALPPAPSERIGSGDSAARHARAERYLQRGDAALAAGMRDTARIAWENALYEYPPLTDAAIELARMLTEDGDGFYARRVLERALHFDPDNPKLLHFRARRRALPDTAR